MDFKNGVLEFEGKKTKIYPNMKKCDFIESDLYSDVLNEDVDDYSNYYLRPQLIGENKFIVRLYFGLNNNICLVNMSITKDGNIPTWDNWSEQDQLVKKGEHDQWLQKNIGKPPYQYSWGEISSTYDPRSGSSTITFTYKT